MKKFIIVFFCFLTVSMCAVFSRDREKSQNSENIESSDVQEQNSRQSRKEKKRAQKEVEPVKESRESKMASKQAEKEAQEAKRLADKQEQKNQKQLDRKGWAVVKKLGDNGSSRTIIVKKNGEDIAIINGVAKIQTVSKNGSVAFYVADSKNSWHPVIETSDFAVSTYVSLIVDDAEYRFNRLSKTEYFYEVDDDSVSVNYELKNLAQFKVTYKFESEAKNSFDATSILVYFSFVNLDSNPHRFSVKNVYNTTLGESAASHFSMPYNRDINSEIAVQPSAKNNFVVSSDGKRVMKFTVFGNGIVAPQKVVLANKDVLENASLSTLFKIGRSFNSVLSYNNSGVGLFWNGKVLDSADGKVFYKITLSNAAFKNLDSIYYSDIEEEEVLVEIAPPQQEQSQVLAAEEDIEKNTPPKQEKETEPQGEKQNYGFDTERNYLDPSINEDYVRRLIDEINALEHSDSVLNREKIRELQNEIDEVLEVLRSRR